MKIQVHGNTLNAILKIIKPFINLKNFKNLPIMHTVKITSFNNIYVEVTNLEIAISIKVDGIELESGEVCINFKDLQQVVKGQKDALITISEREILCGNMPVNINSFPAEEYPTLPTLDKGFKEYYLTNDFIQSLKTCLPYAADEDINRPVYASIWIDNKNISATDTHSMIIYKQNCILNHEKSIPIPATSVKAIAEVFKKLDSITCRISDDLIIITDQNGVYTVTARLLSGGVKPPYENITKNLPKTINGITVNTKEFFSVVNSLPLSPEKGADKVAQIDFDPEIGVTMKTDIVKPFTFKCEPVVKEKISIAYNNDLFKRIIGSFQDEKITFEFSGRANPIVAKNDNVFTLFLPVRS